MDDLRKYFPYADFQFVKNIFVKFINTAQPVLLSYFYIIYLSLPFLIYFVNKFHALFFLRATF